MTSVLQAPALAASHKALPLIEMQGVEKVYRTGKLEFAALKGIDIAIWPGEMVAIVGPSGSGKSTVLNLLTGIDRPSAGRVVVDGADLATMNEEQLARWRGRTVGIVFQFFQLLPTLSALDNAALPMDFAHRGKVKERMDRARQHLDLVRLAHKATHFPSELSGGEQQRVAIARALACDPKLVVGDEPTGNLDSVTARDMFDLFSQLNAEGKTIVYVTHDLELARRAHRVVSIRDGLVVESS